MTDLLLPALEIAANRFGAKWHSGPTGAQLSVHSLDEHPSPKITVMLTAAMAATVFFAFDGNEAQQLPCAVLLSHSQRSLNANPKKRRSRTRKPPRQVGLQTVVHVTLHFPLVVDSAPGQRNASLRLSI